MIYDNAARQLWLWLWRSAGAGGREGARVVIVEQVFQTGQHVRSLTECRSILIRNLSVVELKKRQDKISWN